MENLSKYSSCWSLILSLFTFIFTNPETFVLGAMDIFKLPVWNLFEKKNKQLKQ